VPTLSVIICTYNPNRGIFSKCLDAISEAAEQHKPFEIIIIDNNSDNSFSETGSVTAFCSKHDAKIIAEKKQGLTHARLRGIQEATGDILAFIDDDNIINSNFFSEVLKIAQQYPEAGAFSGQVSLMYDEEPPQWTKRYWGMLVHRSFSGVHLSAVPFDQSCMPCGAGLCVKKEVAEYYAALHRDNRRSFYLDRSKGDLLSGGDNDLAMCACDTGMKMGLFENLSLLHYTPSSRFTLAYLKNLAYGIYYSEKILKYMRLGKIEKLPRYQKVKSYLRTFLMKPNDGVINRACIKGAADAVSMLEKRK
jgi:glycosyltransferase involved in cell wall biosynthesis